MEYKELYKQMRDEQEKILDLRHERYSKLDAYDLWKELSWMNPMRKEPELTEEGKNALLLVLFNIHQEELKAIALKYVMNKEVTRLVG